MKKGFTLAEVLIVLGIIGVVAALTIPTLINSYQEKATVTRLKKVYSTLSQAYQMAIIENGEFPDWFEGNDELTPVQKGEIFYNVLSKYFKISKACKGEPGCFTTGYLRN